MEERKGKKNAVYDKREDTGLIQFIHDFERLIVYHYNHILKVFK